MAESSSFSTIQIAKIWIKQFPHYGYEGVIPNSCIKKYSAAIIGKALEICQFRVGSKLLHQKIIGDDKRVGRRKFNNSKD